MSNNDFQMKKGKKVKTKQKETDKKDTFLQYISENDLCVFSLVGDCKNQCKGAKKHQNDKDFYVPKVFQMIIKTPWNMHEWKTPLNEIAEKIKSKAYSEYQDIHPFVRTCLFSALGQERCDNWRNHRMVEIEVNFNGKQEKIYACYTKAVDWKDKKTGKTEKRAFCGLHFDISFIQNDNNISFQNLMARSLPQKKDQKKMEKIEKEEKAKMFQEKKKQREEKVAEIIQAEEKKQKEEEKKQEEEKLKALSKDSFPEMESSNVEISIKKTETIWERRQFGSTNSSSNFEPKDISEDDVNFEIESKIHESRLYNNLWMEFIVLSEKHEKLLKDYAEIKEEAEYWRAEAEELRDIELLRRRTVASPHVLQKKFHTRKKMGMSTPCVFYRGDGFSPSNDDENPPEDLDNQNDEQYDFIFNQMSNYDDYDDYGN